MADINNMLSLLDVFEEADRRAEQEARILFDSGEPSKDELEMIFDNTLDFESKKAKLQVMRGQKTVTPKAFRKRITQADRLHAHSLGIKL